VDSSLPAYRGGVGERERSGGPLSAASNSRLDRRSRRSGKYQQSSLLLGLEVIALQRNSQQSDRKSQSRTRIPALCSQ
jgi:hypothetical protein